jgi:iron complex transport system substrate-binding protein
MPSIENKIVSFLPSATEMVCALGLADQLVGITHECDYPREIKGKPVVVRNVLPIETMTQGEIDVAVAARMRNGQSLYQVDEELLTELAPDLILTQNLCQVCAPSGNEVKDALKLLAKEPQILWLTPHSIDEIWDNLRELGQATGRDDQAAALIEQGQSRLERIRSTTEDLTIRPRVFCQEWLDPVFASGHWMPEMVDIAGGIDALGKAGADSVRVTWEDVIAWAPDILIITPCGYNLDQTVEQALNFFNSTDRDTPRLPEAFFEIPAVRDKRVFAVDANSYFARPGPRVVDGTELLAHLIHPELFDWDGPRGYQRVDVW